MERIVKKESFPHADEAIENAKAKGGGYWRNAKALGQNLLSGSQFNGQKTWNRTKGFIQKNPAQAIGYAVLLGAVLTVIFYPKGQD